jgi:hypothetical protein
MYSYVMDMYGYVVDMYSYVASNLVPEALHEPIEHVIVLFDRIFRFQDDVLSKSVPCDNVKSSTRYRAQQRVETHKNSWFPNNF